MVLKIFFGSSLEEFSTPLNKIVNGFIMELLGGDNNYHGNESNYCISSIQGGKTNENGKTFFPNGALVAISSNDTTFINKILESIVYKSDDLKLSSLHYTNMTISEYEPFSDYDVIRTISPISLKHNGVFYNCIDNDNFIDKLRTHCISKLIKNGVSDKVANTISIEPFHLINSKKVCVKIGKSKNISSKLMLIVKGDKEPRKKLYNMGLGRCTGFGFGFVEIMNRHMF